MMSHNKNRLAFFFLVRQHIVYEEHFYTIRPHYAAPHAFNMVLNELV